MTINTIFATSQVIICEYDKTIPQTKTSTFVNDLAQICIDNKLYALERTPDRKLYRIHIDSVDAKHLKITRVFIDKEDRLLAVAIQAEGALEVLIEGISKES